MPTSTNAGSLRRAGAGPAGLSLFVMLAMATWLPAAGARAQCLDFGGDLVPIGEVALPQYSEDMVADGDYVYILAGDFAGYFLKVVDAADPVQPIVVFTLPLSSLPRCLDVEQDLLAIGRSGGVDFFDIADPAAPLLVGGLNLPGSAVAMDLAGGLAYLGTTSNPQRMVQIVDVADPGAAVILGSFPLPDDSVAGSAMVESVAVRDGYAYVAVTTAGLLIADVSTPSAPIVVGGTATALRAVDVALHGSFAVVADGLYGVTVVDIADPLQPSITANVRTPDAANSVAMAGDIAVVATTYGVQAVDLGDPRTPLWIGGLSATPRQVRDALPLGGRVVSLESGARLRVLDFAVPAPGLAGSFALPGPLKDVEVAGPFGYAVTGAPGVLLVVGLSDPDLPVVLAQVPVGDETFEMGLDSGLVGVSFRDASGQTGVRFVDVSSPTSPAVVGTFNGTAAEVVMSGGHAFLPGATGTRIVDVTTPAAPTLVGTIPTLGHVAVVGALAYVAGPTGLRIWDISTPSSPLLRGSESPNVATSGEVAVSGDWAYVDNGAGTLRILRISDPTRPATQGSRILSSRCAEIRAQGQWACVALDRGEVLVINAVNPDWPVVAGSFGTAGAARGLSLGLGRAWAGADLLQRGPYQCQFVAPVSDVPPVAAERLRAFPNPFNPLATIAFDLERAGPVALDVFSPDGRRLRTLMSADLPAGHHEAVWDGRDERGRLMASGTYLCRLQTAAESRVTRITLLK